MDEMSSTNRTLLWTVIILFFGVAMGLCWWFFLRPSEIANLETPLKESGSQETRTKEKWTRSDQPILKNVTSTDTHKLSDGTFRMFYMNEGKIVYANSSDGINFDTAQPTGIVEDKDMFISNPSLLEIKTNEWIMIYEQQPIQKTGSSTVPGTKTQRNLYLAVSADGKSFIKLGLAIDSSKEDNFFASVPDLVKLPNGSVRLYFVSGGDAIASAVSPDGKNWQRENGFRLKDKAVDPDVLVLQEGAETHYVMYYSVLTGADNKLYKAISKDGLVWEKTQSVVNPLAKSSSVLDPDVFELSPNHFKMFFGEARDANTAFGGAGQIDLYSAELSGSVFE